MNPDPDLTIVLLGKTGVGKSATGNMILGQEAFVSKRSFKSVTTTVNEKTESVCEKQVSVIDTPGILESEQQIEKCCQDVLQNRRPYLFLVVVKIDRFTEEDRRAVNAAVRLLGDHGLAKSYLLFTGEDTLSNMSLKEFIFEEESPLTETVKLFKDKYYAFNNKNGGHDQVRKLLEISGNISQVTAGLVERKIVLFGLSGSGKSSSGNNILGSDQFKADCDFETVTVNCDCKSAAVEGRMVTVIDTPGFTDERLSKEVLSHEILKAVKENGQGIHAFIIVVQLGRIFEAHHALLQQLPKLFGSNALKYTMVLFTHGDKLSNQKDIEDKILASKRTSDLFSMCCRRYCLFDNTERKNTQQVRELLDKIDKMVDQNGGHPCPSGTVHPTMNCITKVIDLIRRIFHRENSEVTQPLLG